MSRSFRFFSLPNAQPGTQAETKMKAQALRSRLFKYVLPILLLAFSLILISFAAAHFREMKRHEAYRLALKDFKAVHAEDFSHIPESTYLLYIGRYTCPDCRNFVPLMTEVLDELSPQALPLYMLNCDQKSEADLKWFKSAHIKEVPTVLIIQNGQQLQLSTRQFKAQLEDYLGAISD